MEKKPCTGCGRLLPMEAYHRSKAFKATGRSARCKDCVKAYQAEHKKTEAYKRTYSTWWETTGRDKQREKNRHYASMPGGNAYKKKYQKTEKFRAAQKRYTSSAKGRATQKAAYAKRMTDPEYREKQRANYRRWNKRKAAKEAQKRYFQSPKGKTIKQKKDKAYKSSPKGLEAANRSNTKRKRLKGQVPCTLTLKEWQAIKEAYGHRCAYCGEKKRLTQDHVIPLTKGGHHTKENVVPACGPCNAKKGTKTLTHFPTPEMCGSSPANR